MFTVKPIAEKELQKEICETLHVPYEPQTLAYYAANLNEDRETVAEYIGICQFTVGETGTIVTLSCPPSFITDEAMIVLCRAVMFFMHRVGIHSAEMSTDAGPDALLSKTGFSLHDRMYQMDLEAFYAAPCKYETE